MKTHSDAQTTEEIFQDFLRCQVEEQLDFESLLARYPEHERELRRLRAGLPIPVSSSGGDSFFCLPSDRERITAVADAELRPGRHIGGFELIERIGAGGMGEVWEARQTALDRRVALKFIRSDHLTQTMVERFHVEARAGGRLNHPNIVALYDHGQSEGRYWIAQELVLGGCTLADTVHSLKEEEHLPTGYYRKVAELFVAIADGLQAAHEAGVVHRDIKPQNILITPRDVPKVGDFGLARIVDDAPLTVGQAGGTPNYMSPEQIDPGPAPIDGRADIFSLGAVLYELLTFRRAFGGSTSASVLHRIVAVDPEHPRDIEPRIPDELAVIALAALEKRRVDRYQTMRELACDLRRFLRDEPILRKPDTLWMRIRKWARRNPARAVALALGVLLVATASVFVPVLLGQKERARRAEQESLLVEALRKIDHGDLTAARELSVEAQALDPDDPTPHVYLATGFARYSRFDEAEDELAQARAKGLREEAPTGDLAEEHLTYGLFRMLDGRSRGWPDAERHLTRAYELDPSLEGTLFPLYQVRRALGDDEGARAPLASLSGKLAPEDPFSVVAEALLLQLGGELEKSTERLESLLELTPEERDALRLHRLLARNYLLLSRWDAALTQLVLHFEEFPKDQKALTDLARALWSRSMQAPLEADASLARGIEAAEKAAQWDADWTEPHELATKLWLRRLNLRDINTLPPKQWTDELEYHLENWERAAPTSDSTPLVRAELAFLHALPAWHDDDEELAESLFQECLDRNPQHFKAAALLAHRPWTTLAEAQESLVFLDQADRAWRPEHDPDRRWRLAIDVWTFHHADRVGDVKLARKALAAAYDGMFDAREQGSDIINLAEFLALARTPELRDCDAAIELIDEWHLPELFDEPAAGRTLARILGHCG